MTEAQTHTARLRLALGISNVGFWVLAALAGVLWLNSGSRAPSVDKTDLIKLLFSAAVVQSFFDVAGGFFLMPRSASGSKLSKKQLFRGVLVHCVLLCVAGSLHYWSFLMFKEFYVGIAVSMLGLFFLRRRILLFISGLRHSRSTHAGEHCWSAESLDPSFTGGTSGMGPRTTILLPQTWRTQLSAGQIETVVKRRLWEIQNHLPARSFLFVLLWNLLGCRLGSQLFDIATRSPEQAMLLQACWMTLWGFAGLLALPSLSRSTVFGADHAAETGGCDAGEWIRLVPEITGEDGGGSPLSQKIFYPIPSTAERLSRLRSTPPRIAFGNVARTNLFLSLATLTLLGRCVHCNAGRPDLWVFPPTD